MQTINLEGLRVDLGDPVMVGEGVGHHWFPQIAQFPTGELCVSVSVNPDAHKLAFGAQGLYFSTDEGKTWERRYTVTEAANGINIPRPNGDLLVLGRVLPDPAGQWHTFSGNYVRYQDGGHRLLVEDRALHIEGLPKDILPFEEEKVFPGTPHRGWLTFDGNAIEFEGQLLATIYVKFQGDRLYSTLLLNSEDEGHTWRYISTVAGPDAVPDATEGPCEPHLAVLETGELMCVMRVGSGSQWNLARSYSGDGGRTWSPVDRLPAFSVEPCLRRLHNGTLVISSGRAGIYLWLSTDPRGESWQQIDLVSHHNGWAPGASHTIVPETSGIREERHARDQTTAYTEIVEIAPNRLLLTYDRTPFGWQPVPIESEERSRVYVLPIEIERSG